MNKARIKQLNKKVDKLIGDKELPVFPLMGGGVKGVPTRQVTQEEYEILKIKEKPIPILIDIDREEEFQEYLRT